MQKNTHLFDINDVVLVLHFIQKYNLKNVSFSYIYLEKDI